MNDQENEGKFVWSDGSSLDYTNWLKDEPDGERNENFVTIMNYAKRSGKWNDDGSQSKEKGYLCRNSLSASELSAFKAKQLQ